MKKLFPVLSLTIILCLLMSTTLLAVNEEYVIQPRWTNISQIATGLDIALSGKATCYTSVALYTSSNCTCTIEMVLQQSDGSGWDDIKSWSISGGTDTGFEKYWYIDSGYEYQVESTTYVYNADGDLVETAVTHSPIDSF